MKLEDIDTSTIEGKIKVMQAYAAGRKLVYKDRRFNTWIKCNVPLWNWAEYDYAVVKAPCSLWLVEVKHAVSGVLYTTYYCNTEQEAEGCKREWKCNSGGDFDITITKFVEA